MKTLREWLIENNLSHHDMSKRLGTSQQNVSRWMGRTTPSLEMAVLIEQITGGEVECKAHMPDAKYEGDKRLVQAGKMSRQYLSKWERK